MVDTDIEGRVAGLVAGHSGPAVTVRGDATWLTVFPAGAALADHGWKLHVSCRVSTFPELVDSLVPVLLAEGCVFKLARSAAVLKGLNDGVSSPATVGKAFTVYPDQGRVRELGLRLADLLRGTEGPRVLSDQRVTPDAPVFYRYGPFVAPWTTDAQGRLITMIHGPAGEEFGALATLQYRQPSWVVDPFTGATGHEEDASLLVGDHYRIVEGVFESGRGNVYRATDERDGGRVIVKQARALVDEHDASGDVRMRLRNERRVLESLAGYDGVSRFLDHFRHGDDEFLVTADAGPYNLDEDIAHDGRYGPGGRDLADLAARLSGIVLDLHARGVIVRDLSPKNVVIDAGRVTLIDLGLAAYDGLHIPGGTPGYAPARQCRDEPPLPHDDLHALGMTLLTAANGLSPISVGDDHDLARIRALQVIRATAGPAPTGVLGAVADLLSGDAEAATRAAHRLAGRQPAPSATTSPEPADRRPAPSVTTLPALPEPTEDLVAEIVDNLLADLLDQTRRVLTASTSRSIAHDASVYAGSAGIGLELLEHLDRPGVADLLADLVPFTVRAMEKVNLPPGLLVGRTGVDVFLRRAAEHGITADGYAGPAVPGPDWKPEGEDLIVGAAGVGLGHLLLGGETHREVAVRCAEHVLTHPVPDAPSPMPPRAAVEPSAGRAHGLAGTVEVLLFVGDAVGDKRLLDAAADRARLLLARGRDLADRVGTPYSAPLAASWCQGLAGIGQTLLHAGRLLDDPALTAGARDIARAATVFLPHVSVPSQCCGMSGVGNLLIDVAVRESSEEHWAAARVAARQMLLRSAGTPGHPVFMKDSPEDNSASWAFGVAGILAFFRRLSRRGGGTGLPLPG
ncbi:class III lanthionine synthetase LanKC N-terminal domain-containing protein [Longispora fulva]|uniref:non-specific serine/threonine protein kinase n=1 Tax=Longispora fulva TaxID=619741 RepID=A0A8J7KJK0_9ACTN|nr:lanthionine synthetase LanC family protein [Longispora fulva]MBG6135546.1 serine/threonine protein kinase [Longispora fulva]